MRWLVDGMNLIGSRPDGWWRDRASARRSLVEALAGFAAREGLGPGECAVVFDGSPAPGEADSAAASPVDVSYAPGGPDAADRVIAAMVEGMADPAGCTVVSSDGALAARVARAGAAVMGVGAFRRRLDGR